jgi:hypothetical protein
MLDRIAELGGQLTVRDKHESDHSFSTFVIIRSPDQRTIMELGIRSQIVAASEGFAPFRLSGWRERYLVDAEDVDKPKIAPAQAILTHCNINSSWLSAEGRQQQA